MTVSMTGMPYSAVKGGWKSTKDWVMTGAAAAIAIIGMNIAGIANQCPDATVTVLGVTITLKALMQFANNWRKNA